MKSTIQKIHTKLMKPEVKKEGMEQIKKKARTSILEKLKRNKAEIERQNNMTTQKIAIRNNNLEL